MAGDDSIKRRGVIGEKAYPAEYLAWTNMKRRCQSPTSTSYPYYGARGVTVCERWQDFSAFLADMGRRPSKAHSLDRIDTDGPYSPENCQWATKDTQQQNRRYCRLNPEKVAHVWRLHALGQTPLQIARAVDCGAEHVKWVISGKGWKQYRPATGDDVAVN